MTDDERERYWATLQKLGTNELTEAQAREALAGLTSDEELDRDLSIMRGDPFDDVVMTDDTQG